MSDLVRAGSSTTAAKWFARSVTAGGLTGWVATGFSRRSRIWRAMQRTCVIGGDRDRGCRRFGVNGTGDERRMSKQKTITHIADLTPDPRNARKHNPRNIGVIENALREL